MIDNDGDLVNSFCFFLCVANKNKKEKKLKMKKKYQSEFAKDWYWYNKVRKIRIYSVPVNNSNVIFGNQRICLLLARKQ